MLFPANIQRTAPRGTNRYPWDQPIRFNAANPFDPTAMGAISGDAAATETDHGKLVTSENFKPNSANAAADLWPIAVPADMHDSCNYWIEQIGEAADLIVIRPYMALYDQLPDPTAFDTDPAASALAAKLQFFLIKRASPPIFGQPLEFNAEYAGAITIANNGVVLNALSKRIPAKAQGVTITITDDALPPPGLQIEGTLGAEMVTFDQRGAEYLLTYASGVTANAAVGWERTHI